MYTILPVHKTLINQMMNGKESKVYSLMIQLYAKEMLELGPTIFRKWISSELGLPEEKINLSSLNSALARYRKSICKPSAININL